MLCAGLKLCARIEKASQMYGSLCTRHAQVLVDHEMEQRIVLYCTVHKELRKLHGLALKDWIQLHAATLSVSMCFVNVSESRMDFEGLDSRQVFTSKVMESVALFWQIHESLESQPLPASQLQQQQNGLDVR